MPELPSHLGPYEIVGPLGAGGMGQVYRARDTRLQRNVAIKMLHEAGALDPERQRRFAHEAVAASALNHPNILTVYDVGVEGDTPYLVSELIEGASLRSGDESRPHAAQARDRDRAPDCRRARRRARGRHRASRSEARERDGDAATVASRSSTSGWPRPPMTTTSSLPAQTQTQTADGLIVGTVPYMSPEQARGGKADFRSDQFALGVMLYEMTTATHPVQARNRGADAVGDHRRRSARSRRRPIRRCRSRCAG